MERLHIAVGVILDDRSNRVLISKRPQRSHLGGLWEFPGGKVKPGENITQALNRELREELAITVKGYRPLIQLQHDYRQESVFLDVYLISGWDGTPVGREGQQIKWVRKTELDKFRFPAANKPIVTAILLPAIYGITPDLPEYGRDFYLKLEKNLAQGMKLLQFRSKKLDKTELFKTVKRVYQVCTEHGCKLLINGLQDTPVLEYVDGIHMTGIELLNCNRRPLTPEYLLAASCHDKSGLEQAYRLEIDFAVLSPVKKTKSHKASEPIGWDVYKQLVRNAALPVYALGGMQKTDIEQAQSSGGQGIAMISGLWSGPGN